MEILLIGVVVATVTYFGLQIKDHIQHQKAMAKVKAQFDQELTEFWAKFSNIKVIEAESELLAEQERDRNKGIPANFVDDPDEGPLR